MRLIDAHALIDEINEMWKIHPAGLENRKILSFEAVIDLIGAAPTIEAKPVVRAHWITEQEAKEMNRYDLVYSCSDCGHCDWDCTESFAFSYCPHCGAQMDESVKIPVISMEDVPKIMEEMKK